MCTASVRIAVGRIYNLHYFPADCYELIHFFVLFFFFPLSLSLFDAWHIFFSHFIQADDGAFVAVCNVNITIRDVNNHAPKFVRDNFMATIAENTAIGKCAMRPLSHF